MPVRSEACLADPWQTGVVRTTLELDDALLEALMARHPGASKTEAIETAVRTYLSTDSTARLRALAGGVEIVDVSAEMRRGDRAT